MAYVVSLTELSRQKTAMSMTNLTQGRRSLLHRSWAFIASFFYEEFCHSKNQASNIVSYYSYHIFIYIYSILFVQKEILHQVLWCHQELPSKALAFVLWRRWIRAEIDRSPNILALGMLWDAVALPVLVLLCIAMTFFILFQSFSYIFYFLFALFLIVFLHITLVYLPCPIPW
jgi:hypothetical protein